MQETETIKENSYSNGETKSIATNGKGMQETLPSRRRSRTPVAADVTPLLVSEQQFVTVREEHLESLNLLNSSGDSLLNALNSMIPPAGSGRVLGDYTAQGMRKISKSLCDIINTKNNVIRQMYSIARDEV